MVDLVTGDTGSILRATCKDNEAGTVIDLNGATVKLRWESAIGTIILKTMTIESAANGIVTYQFLTGEIFAPKMKFEIEITDASTKIITSLSLIELTVREQLG